MKARIVFFGMVVGLVGVAYGGWFGDDVAVRGYDVVSYFEAGEAQKGVKEHAVEHGGETYYFKDAGRKAKFLEDPGKYLPKYEGYCAYAVALGSKVKADPKMWSIVDGELYLNLNKKVKDIWDKDKAGYINKAEKNWPIIK